MINKKNQRGIIDRISFKPGEDTMRNREKFDFDLEKNQSLWKLFDMIVFGNDAYKI